LPIRVGAHKSKGALQPKREPLVRCFLATPARIMRRPRYANECWSRLRSSRRLGLGVSVAGPALDVSPLPGASPHPPRSRAAGVSAGGNLYDLATLKPITPAEVCAAREKGRTSSKPIAPDGGRKLRHDKLDGKGKGDAAHQPPDTPRPLRPSVRWPTGPGSRRGS
jgi:hypothetical protein